MTGSLLQPLPQAPTAHVPAGLTPEGAARGAWRPNVVQWVAVWRLVVIVEGIVQLWLRSDAGAAPALLGAAGAYAVLSTVAAWRIGGPPPRPLLVVDLLACVALLAAAPDQPTFALMALYSYSTVVAWAAGRPIDAFFAGGAAAVAYTVLGLAGPYAASRPAAFVSNLSLYFFFALATSGFFTVARRIGALEVATEISKERGRYRRDLHDRLGQALCGLHFELQALRFSAHDDPDTRMRLESLADGYRSARSMLVDLFRDSDEPLVATDVGALIDQEARRMAAQSGAVIVTRVDGDATRIPPWMRPHIWSVAGECMTNALKNGQAGSVDIELTVEPGLLVLSVTDGGCGFDCPAGELPEVTGHYGLREMQERARLCGGNVVVASQPGFGTRVRLQAPIPSSSSDDIIERDAGILRKNIGTLVTVLRTGLGVVALAQVLTHLGTPRTVAAAGLAAVMLTDLLLPILRPRATSALIVRAPMLLYGHVAAYAALFALSLWAGIPPYFLLYAPLVLLAAGVFGGRRLAAVMTAVFVAMMLGVLLVAVASGHASLTSTTPLMYIANLVIIGMSATQGAKLLDRLEALQIRVRYQALARLRQRLNTRMRDELFAGLDKLGETASTLAGSAATQEEFAQATARLEEGSNELKARLRAIVHQLADDPSVPTPGRATSYV